MAALGQHANWDTSEKGRPGENSSAYRLDPLHTAKAGAWLPAARKRLPNPEPL